MLLLSLRIVSQRYQQSDLLSHMFPNRGKVHYAKVAEFVSGQSLKVRKLSRHVSNLDIVVFYGHSLLEIVSLQDLSVFLPYSRHTEEEAGLEEELMEYSTTVKL